MQKQQPFTVFSLEIISERDGFTAFLATGERAKEVFANEAGGHRWQRVPPTEKRVRVHTSTITVAVMPLSETLALSLNQADLEIRTTRGSGPGGQHRNKTESEVVIKHIPTGLEVCSGGERSQYQNKQIALQTLAARLNQAHQERGVKEANQSRKGQIGSGQRGDKIRTIRTQDNTVKCDLTGKTSTYTQYAKGHILF